MAGVGRNSARQDTSQSTEISTCTVGHAGLRSLLSSSVWACVMAANGQLTSCSVQI